MGRLTTVMSASWSLPAARRYPRWGWRVRPPLGGQFQWPAGIAEVSVPSAGAAIQSTPTAAHQPLPPGDHHRTAPLMNTAPPSSLRSTGLRRLVTAGLLVLAFGFCLTGFAGAQSPDQLNGRTLRLSISSGTAPFPASGSYQLISSSISDAYAITPTSGPVSPSTGTQAYTRTGPTTGRLDMEDSALGALRLDCSFVDATSGTYTLARKPSATGSQTGTFTLFSSTAPDRLDDFRANVQLTAGVFPFASSGSFALATFSTGNRYTITGTSGDVADTSGTLEYFRISQTGGLARLTDSTLGLGFTADFSFETPISGTLFVRWPGFPGYQTGDFVIVSGPIPPFVVEPPRDQFVSVGKTATFSVQARGLSPLRYQWRKNSVWIEAATAASYSISPVSEEDQGLYDVLIQNNEGETLSAGAHLVVLIQPSISTQPVSQSALIGTSVGFDVGVQGTMPFTFQWYKEGVEIPEATGSSYIISNAALADEGAYTVVVTNQVGTATSDPATLQIERIATTPALVSSPLWTPHYGFSFSIQGEPKTSYTIERSLTLTTWYPMRRFVATDSPYLFEDTAADSYPASYYRVVSP